MTFASDSAVSDPYTTLVAEAFVPLVAAAWFVAPGIAVAVACYAAWLVSQRLLELCRSAATRTRALLALALTWLVVLTLSALVLPSNFSTAVI